MNNMTFLYEENGFKVYKLQFLGSSYFIVENNESKKRYIRRSLKVVDKIVRNKGIQRQSTLRILSLSLDAHFTSFVAQFFM